MTYEQTIEELARSLRFGIEPSLDGIRLLTERLKRPQDRFVSIQVAGTNGKTSTARAIAAILRGEGFHVGLYTSPHLVEYTERIEIDGVEITHDAFARHMGRVFEAARGIMADQEGSGTSCVTDGGGTAKPAAIDHKGNPVERAMPADALTFTEFELLTAAAFDAFAAAQVDFAVLEVGLGGRWDATSIVNPSVAVICGIGLDHMKILGDTVEAIAHEKAAIIKPATAVVLGPGTAQTKQVFLDRTQECGTYARAVFEGGPNHPSPFPEVPVQLSTSYMVGSATPDLVMDVNGCHGEYRGLISNKPVYQAQNIATAICAAEAALGRALDDAALHESIRTFPTPGRFETLREHPLLMIDSAHNPQSAEFLAESLCERFRKGRDGRLPLTLLLAILADKDYDGIIAALAPLFSEVIVSQSSSPRALDTDDLAEAVRKTTGSMPRAIRDLDEAVRSLESCGSDVIATGSITTAGQVRALFR